MPVRKMVTRDILTGGYEVDRRKNPSNNYRLLTEHCPACVCEFRDYDAKSTLSPSFLCVKCSVNQRVEHGDRFREAKLLLKLDR